MGREFVARSGELDALLACGRTTDYWYVWSDAVEEAYVKARNLSEDEGEIKGRGRVLFETAKTHEQTCYIKESEEDEWTTLIKKHVDRKITTARMLQQLLNITGKPQPARRGVKKQASSGTRSTVS